MTSQANALQNLSDDVKKVIEKYYLRSKINITISEIFLYSIFAYTIISK